MVAATVASVVTLFHVSQHDAPSCLQGHLTVPSSHPLPLQPVHVGSRLGIWPWPANWHIPGPQGLPGHDPGLPISHAILLATGRGVTPTMGQGDYPPRLLNCGA